MAGEGTRVAPSRRWRWPRRGPGGPAEDAGARGSVWSRGRVLALLAALTAALLLFHRAVPNTVVRLGSLLESFLPWLGVVTVLLLGLAVLRRSATAAIAVLLPVLAWASQFGALLRPGPEPGARALLVVQHNASDENADPAGTARALAAENPDLIALEELVAPALRDYERVLAADFPYHAVRGTVGLWSKYPLTGVRQVDIKPEGITEPWNRGLRTVVRTPHGDLAAYVAHLPSVRVGASGLTSAWRDESAGLLGAAVAAEEADRVLLMGDLNGTVDDRGLTPLTARLDVPDGGFAFSFPAGFPVARIDQIMAASAGVGPIRTLPATGSDHLPVAARVELG